jgi:hypothetical protein
MQQTVILGSPESKSIIFQQGDCVLKKCGTHEFFEYEYPAIPKEAKPVEGNLVLKGQSNSHALYDGKFQLYRYNDVLFLKVEQPTILDHVKDHLKIGENAEHHAQWISIGEYFLDAVLEYDHLKEESRRIID